MEKHEEKVAQAIADCLMTAAKILDDGDDDIHQTLNDDVGCLVDEFIEADKVFDHDAVTARVWDLVKGDLRNSVREFVDGVFYMRD